METRILLLRLARTVYTVLPSNVTQTAKQVRFLEKTLFTPLDGNLGTPWLVWLTTTINKQELERIKSQMSCNRKQTFSCFSRTDLDPGVECPQTGMIGITLISQGAISYTSVFT